MYSGPLFVVLPPPLAVMPGHPGMTQATANHTLVCCGSASSSRLLRERTCAEAFTRIHAVGRLPWKGEVNRHACHRQPFDACLA